MRDSESWGGRGPGQPLPSPGASAEACSLHPGVPSPKNRSGRSSEAAAAAAAAVVTHGAGSHSSSPAWVLGPLEGLTVARAQEKVKGVQLTAASGTNDPAVGGGPATVQ